jgi:four helix bundle protein
LLKDLRGGSGRDYLQFLNVALGSACEVGYLLELSMRLGFIRAGEADATLLEYQAVIRGLQRLVDSIAEREMPTAVRPRSSR